MPVNPVEKFVPALERKSKVRLTTPQQNRVVNSYELQMGFVPKHKSSNPQLGVLGRIDNSEHFINSII